jgi:RNA polymerase sigma-70 factor (ECF subfamily)
MTMADAHSPDDLDRAVAVFGEVRPRLFGIAYRMLGSVVEAEDLVQDVWLRWQGADRGAVREPAAFLATAITRLAINALQSARVRRETYIGPWLPEPVDTSADPYLGAERAEALGFAVLLLMERLTPNERAAYVLREAFDYPYPQIADILQVSEPATRQLVSRARKHVLAERRAPVAADQQHRLLTAFVAAARDGDLAALESLFAADATSMADSNGTVRAASRTPVVGATRLAKVVRAYASTFWVGVDVQWATTNGQPAALLRRDGAMYAVITVAASAEGIYELLWHMNPAKLGGAVTDGGAVRS